MKKKGKLLMAGMLGVMLAFGLVLAGCAGFSGFHLLTDADKATYTGGATKDNAVFIHIGMYSVSIDGQSLGNPEIVGILPGRHTIHVEANGRSGMPPVARKLTLDSDYNFELGKKYWIYTNLLYPAKKTGRVQTTEIKSTDGRRMVWYEWSGVYLSLSGGKEVKGPGGNWWNDEYIAE
jgi:hypothetical protein